MSRCWKICWPSTPFKRFDYIKKKAYKSTNQAWSKEAAFVKREHQVGKAFRIILPLKFPIPSASCDLHIVLLPNDWSTNEMVGRRWRGVDGQKMRKKERWHSCRWTTDVEGFWACRFSLSKLILTLTALFPHSYHVCSLLHLSNTINLLLHLFPFMWLQPTGPMKGWERYKEDINEQVCVRVTERWECGVMNGKSRCLLHP